MRNRLLAWVVLGLVAAAVVGQQPEPARPLGLYTHRDGFSGRQTAWLPGDANVRVVERDHRITEDRYFNAPSSEYLKVEAQPAGGTADAEFAHYFYETPPAPVAEGAAAGVWVKAFRAGVQLRARVVLPKERDPNAPDVPFTALIVGDTYPEEKVRSWHRLRIADPADALRKQLPVLTARLGHQADPTDAYIDRLVLNVYPGPGVTEVWIDDLEIGPCRPDPKRPGGNRTPAATTGRPVPAVAHPYAVEFVAGKIVIDKKPFFMRMIRHTDTGPLGLKELRDAKFNTVYFPADADPGLIDEAVTKHQFMIVAGVPAVPAEVAVGTGALEREADKLAEHFRRFRSGDGVLMWDLGGGRTREQVKTVARTAEVLREYDARRPRAVDLWDGYQAYADYLDVIGTHRWPLFTSLDLDMYRYWLTQRRALTGPGKLLWTWVQTHMPDWYVTLANTDPATGRPGAPSDLPLGPQPEQLRLLTYISIAAGCRGLGFWSDRFLANSHYGRDRLIELFLLNCEMELLEPVLFAVDDEKTDWVKTSHPYVKAAVLRGRKGIVVLPVWVGPGTQYCADQGALPELKINVPQVPEGADPWLLTPASYHNLRAAGGVKNIPPGVEITIPQFDLTAAVVFTQDTSPDGIVVRWQDNIRHVFGRRAAEYAREMAQEAYNKTHAVHDRLAGVAPPVRGADELFADAKRSIRRAEIYLDNGQPDLAYREARRALRPLRVLMRDHWEAATKTLDVPTASPYAVSFYTLPRHWELARLLQTAAPGPNALPHGGFELDSPAPPEGAAVESLPGWGVRQTTLDPVLMTAAVINTEKLGDKIPPRKEPKPPPGVTLGRYTSSRIEAARNPTRKPGPDLGRHALMMMILAKPPKGMAAAPPLPPPGTLGGLTPGGTPGAIPGTTPDPKEKLPPMPGALERTFLAVDSPAVRFPPGTWVRISFWAKVGGVAASADGAMVYDTAGGEPLAARIPHTVDVTLVPPALVWQEFHLYRQVPASGKIGVTIALTGLGVAYFDDVRIEPLTPVEVAGRFQPDPPPRGKGPGKAPPGTLTARPAADPRPGPPAGGPPPGK